MFLFSIIKSDELNKIIVGSGSGLSDSANTFLNVGANKILKLEEAMATPTHETIRG